MKQIVIAILLVVASPAFAQTHSALPDWWHDHVDFITRDGGTWVTPNPDVIDDPRSPDHYGMKWRAENNGTMLRGRLYGIRDGEVIGEYWTFAEFWHPGESKVVIEQWSANGGYGVGETRSIGEHQGETEQTFWTPDGQETRSGHRTVEDGDRYLTQTFSIDQEGNWTRTGGFNWDRMPTES